MRPQPLLRVLSRRQLAIHCSPRVGRLCASASASASFAATSQSRLLHAAPSDARSPPYNSAASFIRHHIPPEVSDRYVMVRSGPVFAIEDDHRELFEESGIAVDKTHMIYNNLGHTDLFLVIVILKSPAQVATAIKELDGAPLFNKRIQVGLSKGPLKTLPSFRWGWYATESSSLHGLALRYPQVSPPRNIFSSYRTGRMVTFHEFPNDNELYLECMKWLYARLHHYNVRGLSRMIAYTPRGCPDIKRSFVTVQFETKEAAEEVQSLYNNQHFHGFPIAVGITKPPMKYLGASWDTGHNQAHNQPRDHGTAEGTNFESMQDEVYRKWLLGSQDRSIWVPGHQY